MNDTPRPVYRITDLAVEECRRERLERLGAQTLTTPELLAIIVVHNHPSGVPTPSPDDAVVTRAIVQAGKLLDVDLLDHLIIGHGKDNWIPMKERGLGFA